MKASTVPSALPASSRIQPSLPLLVRVRVAVNVNSLQSRSHAASPIFQDSNSNIIMSPVVVLSALLDHSLFLFSPTGARFTSV